MRYKITLSYWGKHYHGWQFQPNQVNLQQTFEEALSLAFQEKINIVGAGRTDTGVSAKKYIAHFDTDQTINNKDKFIFKINTLLPADIALQNIEKTRDNFHARFDANERTYQYQVTQLKNPFLIDSAYFIKNKIDFDIMNEACEILKKHTNFKAFSKVKTNVYTFNCEIYEAKWFAKDDYYIFEIKANRFLRNMVRAIVGTLIEVGLHKINLNDFEKIIISQDRRNAGKSVPAHALFLTDIGYN
ncbi:tRNA pseudouridine(38-40) synthase TruA [Psychroflexus halocasei]|uniref:tRNA pseudouridine synthase A n=1 Tax=Psychroflexus halocasei TaxID=908615 RepID=A0A1H3WSL7_9FLAO|nr:tRNA pseudouridine(38-40) synthase TruA [Psychroflexus halocasei]SDZ90145.1 tRNA pseudouridine38-40 synthase [Psychroflexus halocasei]